jgi:ribosomal 50S subunit-recycling heat shock protein
MRLDKYLKVSRLIKRRTVAQSACAGGLVTVNGRVCKSAHDVKPGDEIGVALGGRPLTVRVLKTEDSTKKADAAAMYEVMEQQ